MFSSNLFDLRLSSRDYEKEIADKDLEIKVLKELLKKMTQTLINGSEWGLGYLSLAFQVQDSLSP